VAYTDDSYDLLKEVENNDNTLLSSFKKRAENIKESTQPQKNFYGYKDYDPMHIFETILGEGAGAVGDVVGEAIALPFKAMGLGVPAFVEEWAGNKIQGIADSNVGKATADWAKNNPKDWQKVKNVVNIMTVGTGGSLLKKAKEANKGAWAAGQKNYIPNFYGNDRPDVKPTIFEETLGKQGLKIKGADATPTNVALAGKKLKGMLNWAKDAPANIADATLNPKSRALFAETGISRKGQKAVKDLIDNPNATPRDLEKAAAQVTYNRHNIEQSGRKGEIGTPLLDIEDFNNVQGYKELSKESFRSGSKATKTNIDGKKITTPTKDVDKAYEYIADAWKINPNKKTKIVFKEPSGGASGDHLKDLAFKNPVNKHIREVISTTSGRLTVDNMYKKLLEKSKLKNSGFSVASKSSEDVAKNGLWVQSGMVGTAVVEGGVNALYKVLPNGRVVAYMSDKHDFLEKLPVVGKGLEKSLPIDLLAVSGPMHLDIMNTKWGQKSLKKEGKKYKERSSPTPEKRKGRKDAEDILRSYANTKPTNLSRGFDPIVGVGLMARPVERRE
tara:strand:- start:19 stop:1692 length:1674 start_codon:yes stop_codon:yes gene_type:complete